MHIKHQPNVLPTGLAFVEPASPQRQEKQAMAATGPSARLSSGTMNTGSGRVMRRTLMMMLAVQGGVLAGRTPGTAQRDQTSAGIAGSMPPDTLHCLPRGATLSAGHVPLGLPADMLKSYAGIAGRRQDVANLDIMNEVLVGGRIDPGKLREAMAKYAPRKLNRALNDATFCGGLAPAVEDSLNRCYDETSENLEFPVARPTTRTATHDEAARFNVVRLAFAELFMPYVPKPAALPPIQVIAEWKTDAPAGTAWVGLTSRSADSLPYDRRHVFISPLLTSEMQMGTLMHELLHAYTHPSVRQDPFLATGLAGEGVVEYLATCAFTKDTADSAYEEAGSHQIVSNVAVRLGKMSGASPSEDPEASGAEILKRTYLSGDEAAIRMTREAFLQEQEEYTRRQSAAMS
jgi:hypothetical protein